MVEIQIQWILCSQFTATWKKGNYKKANRKKKSYYSDVEINGLVIHCILWCLWVVLIYPGSPKNQKCYFPTSKQTKKQTKQQQKKTPQNQNKLIGDWKCSGFGKKKEISSSARGAHERGEEELILVKYVCVWWGEHRINVWKSQVCRICRKCDDEEFVIHLNYSFFIDEVGLYCSCWTNIAMVDVCRQSDVFVSLEIV